MITFCHVFFQILFIQNMRNTVFYALEIGSFTVNFKAEKSYDSNIIQYQSVEVICFAHFPIVHDYDHFPNYK